METPKIFRRTARNANKFRQERNKTIFKKAWEYKTGLKHAKCDVQIGVLVKLEGKWEVYLSHTRRDWPINFEVCCTQSSWTIHLRTSKAMPDCKIIGSEEFLLPAERKKWLCGMDSDEESANDAPETFHEPFQQPQRLCGTTELTTPSQKRSRSADDSDGPMLYTASDDSDEQPAIKRKKGRISVDSAAAVAQTSSELCGPAQTAMLAPGSSGLSRLEPPALILRSSSSSRLYAREGTMIEASDRPMRAPSTPPTGRRSLFPKRRASTIFNG